MNSKSAAYAVGAGALAAVAAAAFYGTRAEHGKGACPPASAAIAAATAARPGRLGRAQRRQVAAPAAAVMFGGPDGQKLALADFKGRAVLLNLWATWCVPCRAEMPALDRLQAAAGGPKFEVVAVNTDTARVERAPKFLDEIGVSHLKRYADHTGDAFETLRLAGKALGLPTSLLIDAEGCEIGVVAGPVDWTSPQAAAAMKALAGG